MSWAHILSFSRIVAGPVIAALVLARPGDTYLAGAILFALASLTDAIDGKLARYSDTVSPLGVFLDTTSDKVLVSVVLVAMTVAGLCPAWIPCVVISREFLISGLRSFAASRDRIISAHFWGKGKAAVTMAAMVLVLAAASGRAGGVLSHVASRTWWNGAFDGTLWLLALGAVLTITSGIRYIVDAWPLFQTEPEVSVPQRAAGGKRSG